MDDNQITAFHPGAMSFSEQNHVGDATDIGLGIVSPDGREGMLQHAREFHEAGIPWVFDPGQGMPMFGGDELLRFVEQADYVTVNDYEAQLLQDKTGKKRRTTRASALVTLTLLTPVMMRLVRNKTGTYNPERLFRRWFH